MRGSVVQRYKGSWSVVLDLGYQVDPETGKRRRQQKWITVRGTRRDAEAKLAQLVHDTNRGEFVQPHRRTFGEWLDEWGEKAIKPPARTLRAYEAYRSVIDRHLKPALGMIPLQQLKAADLKRYYTDAQRINRDSATRRSPHCRPRRSRSTTRSFIARSRPRCSKGSCSATSPSSSWANRTRRRTAPTPASTAGRRTR